MKNISRGKEYTEEFKKQIVALYNAGKSIAELVRDYDLRRPTIYLWVKNINHSGSSKKIDNLSDNQKELIELRKRTIQLEMENDILKQAALIMGRKSKQ